jgi:hypothetical protein
MWCASLGGEALQTPQGISLIFAKCSRSLLLGLLFIVQGSFCLGYSFRNMEGKPSCLLQK